MIPHSASTRWSSSMITLAVVIAVVLLGALGFVLVGGSTADHKFTAVSSSLEVPTPLAPTASLPPPTDPVVPAGFQLHRDDLRGYEVAVPEGWIVVDIAAADSVDAAFAVAKEQHPDRATSLDHVRALVTNELLVAIGPLNGALVTEIRVRKLPPLHGITLPNFVASYEQGLRQQSKSGPPQDLVVTPGDLSSRPTLRSSFHTTQTLSSGATDEAYHYVELVEGTSADFQITMNTDTPDESEIFFDQAAQTLTPLR